MNFTPIVLVGFEGRDRALAQIKRYVHDITQIMFYRTNDLINSRRVLWHLEEAIPDILEVCKDGFDVEFARTLAFVHDDVEVITGDVQLYDKERMRSEQLEELARTENEAISILVGMYHSLANGFDYSELLLAAKQKNRIEAQYVSFFDKFDGGGEAWHEVWAGNKRFLRPAGGDGEDKGYVRRLNEFPDKYPLMKPFFHRFPTYLPSLFDFGLVAEKGMPHTSNSLHKDSGYFLYDQWRRTIINREGIDQLITQVEFEL